MIRVATRNFRVFVRMVTRRFGEIPWTLIEPDLLEFSTNRRMGEACGSWSLKMAPRKVRGLAGETGASWHDVVEPSDYVELWVWVPPRAKAFPIMRGLIDTAGETFSIGGGTPAGHSIQIAGRDFGKIALTAKPYYLSDNPVQIEVFKRMKAGFDKITAIGREPAPDDASTSDLLRSRAAAGKAGGVSKVQPLQVLQVIFDEFYKPQRDAWAESFDGGAVPEVRFDAFVDDWESRLVMFNPAFSVQNWDPYAEVWSMLRNFQHWPWRELFFDDDASGPVLRYRPTPWLDRSGGVVQPPMSLVTGGGNVAGNVTQVWPAPKEDRIEWSLFRSDEQVANFFITRPAGWDAFAALALSFGRPGEGLYAQPEFESNPWLVGLHTSPTRESSYHRHGLRIMERRTPYIDADPRTPDGDPMKAAFKAMRDQGVDGNKRLKAAFDHGALLEFGSTSLKGDERMHVGDFIDTGEGTYYIEGLGHHVVLGEQTMFTTGLQVTRGRGHMVRIKDSVAEPATGP